MGSQFNLKTSVICFLLLLVLSGCGGGGGGSNGGGGGGNGITANIPPVADAGADQSIPNGVHPSASSYTITLSGTDSDSDGTVVSRQWKQTDGPDVMNFSGTNTATATFTVDSTTQAYTFSYTVTDNDGAQSTDTVSVYVAHTIYSDSFADPDYTTHWTVENDGGAGSWSASSGQLLQQNRTVELFQSFDATYHLGSYAFLRLSGLSDYRFSVDITPLLDNVPNESEGNDVGIMFRYNDATKDYYRVSMNAQYGFTRFEKHHNGKFQTLAVDARGYVDTQPVNLTAEVNGDTIVVWIDGDPVFAAVDPDISAGTVALYCQDKAEFDNVLITEDPLQPAVVISSPLAYSVATTHTTGTTAFVADAVTLNAPNDSSVAFKLDDGSEIPATPTATYYTAQFSGVADGEHDLTAVLKNADGNELASDLNSPVGTGGDYYVAIGDSITNGFGDLNPDNNESNNGWIIASQGYEAPLENLLAASSRPQIVFNEGIEGYKAADLDPTIDPSIIDSILERHPGANKVLLLIGTNDASSGTSDTDFAASVQNCANAVLDAGIDQIYIATDLPYYNEGTGDLYTGRNDLIMSYNTKIDNIVGASATDNILPGPDFYNVFLNHLAYPYFNDLYYNGLHPNDTGYGVMADKWNDILK